MARDVPVDGLYHEIRKLMVEPAVPIRCKMWAKGELSKVRPDLEQVTRDQGYHDFLLSYIQREATKFKAYKHGDPHNHPYDGTRKKKVCTCTRECPLKREELPKEFRDAPTIGAGARQFRHSHTGHPLVIDDAQDAWGDLLTRVENQLVRILIGLANHVTPADDKWPHSVAPVAPYAEYQQPVEESETNAQDVTAD